MFRFRFLVRGWPGESENCGFVIFDVMEVSLMHIHRTKGAYDRNMEVIILGQCSWKCGVADIYYGVMDPFVVDDLSPIGRRFAISRLAFNATMNELDRSVSCSRAGKYRRDRKAYRT